MGALEEIAAAKAEQAAMHQLQREISRRDRHKASGLVEVVEMYESRIANATATWLACSRHRATLGYLGMARRAETAARG